MVDAASSRIVLLPLPDCPVKSIPKLGAPRIFRIGAAQAA
jgi:hypothetical protein